MITSFFKDKNTPPKANKNTMIFDLVIAGMMDFVFCFLLQQNSRILELNLYIYATLSKL